MVWCAGLCWAGLGCVMGRAGMCWAGLWYGVVVCGFGGLVMVWCDVVAELQHNAFAFFFLRLGYSNAHDG